MLIGPDGRGTDVTPNELLKTPSEYIAEVLPLAADVLAVCDPDGRLSDLQGAQICVNSLKRATSRYDRGTGDWARFAVAAMRADILRAIDRGEFVHPAEALADLVFAANAGA